MLAEGRLKTVVLAAADQIQAALRDHEAEAHGGASCLMSRAKIVAEVALAIDAPVWVILAFAVEGQPGE